MVRVGEGSTDNAVAQGPVANARNCIGPPSPEPPDILGIQLLGEQTRLFGAHRASRELEHHRECGQGARGNAPAESSPTRATRAGNEQRVAGGAGAHGPTLAGHLSFAGPAQPPASESTRRTGNRLPLLKIKYF